MTADPKSDGMYMTEEEYLEFEYSSQIRHEYVDGRIIPQLGENPNHNRLTMKLTSLLFGHIKDTDCDVFGCQMRVNIKKVTAHLYPDLSVTYSPQFTDDPIEALLNPELIIEVFSSTTEAFDRGRKFEMYRQLDSLREYVLVSSDSPHIDHFWLSDNSWYFTDTVGLDSEITLQSIDCTLSLADVYQRVTFEDETD